LEEAVGKIVGLEQQGCRRQRMPETEHTNRLIHESSPYLLQYAHNPVNWYPWSDDAFQKQRKKTNPSCFLADIASSTGAKIVKDTNYFREHKKGLT
jgi:Highly conserved protein containing a thioredoxin domain